MPRPPQALLTTATLLACLLAPAVSEAQPQRLRSNIDRQIRPAEIEPQLADIDVDLRAGRWKKGLKRAQNLTEVVVARTWYGRELRRFLVELAFQQAVAEANLGRHEDAVWHWHVAQNLDPRVFRRDLAPYGRAGQLLYEYPLRAEGEVPKPYEVARPLPGQARLREPGQPDTSRVATILNNTGAAQEGTGDCHVEVIVDRRGRLQQPVVESTHLHPIVIYATLEWLRELPPFEPARYDGEPVDYLGSMEIRFQLERW